MKKFTVLIGLFMSLTMSMAQVPQAFNYQAIIRDADGSPIIDQAVSLRVSILQDSTTGTSVYTEIHTVTTNQFGLVNLGVGTGTIIAGNFSTINWGGGDYFLKVEVDPEGGSDYTDLGTTQLLSVPYALFAQNGGDSYWLPNQNNIYYQAGNVSIGTQTVADGSKLNVLSKISLIDNNNQAKVESGVNPDSSGFVEIYGKNGTRNVVISSKQLGYYLPGNLYYDPNSGFIGIYFSNDTAVVKMTSTLLGYGRIQTYSPLGSELVNLTYSGGGDGRIAVYDSTGLNIALITSAIGGGGWMGTWGSNGNYNCKITSLVGSINNGYISVNNAAGSEKAGIYVDASGQGVVFGDVKNFRMEYPGRKDQEIWYASIEGPEAAAYLRGTARLEDGTTTVTFPDHFRHVISSKNMTVMLTPLSAQSKGLALTEKGTDGFTVVELLNGKGSYEFDWEVKAVRKGYEDYRVIRDKAEDQGADPALLNE